MRRAAVLLLALSALPACQGAAPQQQPPQQGAPAPEPSATPAQPAAAQTLLLKDSGVRCITFPCPSYEVLAQGEREPRPVHELDLSALPSDAERERVQAALKEGVRVEGTLSVRAKAGPAGDATVLRVTRAVR